MAPPASTARALDPAVHAPAVHAPGEPLLRYTERSPVRVVGAASGRAYVFSAVRPVQAVARADAQALLATRFFRLA